MVIIAFLFLCLSQSHRRSVTLDPGQRLNLSFWYKLPGFLEFSRPPKGNPRSFFNHHAPMGDESIRQSRQSESSSPDGLIHGRQSRSRSVAHGLGVH